MSRPPSPPPKRTTEPGRARYPDREGHAERDGVRLYYEIYGEGNPTLVFLPAGPASHSRAWKAQVPDLSRRFRVLAFDCRGGGRSDRPRGVDAYRGEELAGDALAVMEAAGIERAVIVSHSAAARPALWLLSHRPERFLGAVFIAPYLPLTRWPPVETLRRTFEERRAWRRALSIVRFLATGLPTMMRFPGDALRFTRGVRFMEGGTKFNRHHLLRDQRDWVEWFVRTLDLTEPHSTRQIEDVIEWAMEADSETLVDFWTAFDIVDDALLRERDEILAACERVRCPVLVVCGELDIAIPPHWAASLAAATGGRLLRIPAAAHVPQGRKPVPVNLALREFAESLPAEPGERRSQLAVQATEGGSA